MPRMSEESRSDGGMKDADITSALGVGQSTVERIRKRCVEEGVDVCADQSQKAPSVQRCKQHEQDCSLQVKLVFDSRMACR